MINFASIQTHGQRTALIGILSTALMACQTLPGKSVQPEPMTAQRFLDALRELADSRAIEDPQAVAKHLGLRIVPSPPEKQYMTRAVRYIAINLPVWASQVKGGVAKPGLEWNTYTMWNIALNRDVLCIRSADMFRVLGDKYAIDLLMSLHDLPPAPKEGGLLE